MGFWDRDPWDLNGDGKVDEFETFVGMQMSASSRREAIDLTGDDSFYPGSDQLDDYHRDEAYSYDSVDYEEDSYDSDSSNYEEEDYEEEDYEEDDSCDDDFYESDGFDDFDGSDDY